MSACDGASEHKRVATLPSCGPAPGVRFRRPGKPCVNAGSSAFLPRLWALAMTTAEAAGKLQRRFCRWVNPSHSSRSRIPTSWPLPPSSPSSGHRGGQHPGQAAAEPAPWPVATQLRQGGAPAPRDAGRGHATLLDPLAAWHKPTHPGQETWASRAPLAAGLPRREPAAFSQHARSQHAADGETHVCRCNHPGSSAQPFLPQLRRAAGSLQERHCPGPEEPLWTSHALAAWQARGASLRSTDVGSAQAGGCDWGEPTLLQGREPRGSRREGLAPLLCIRPMLHRGQEGTLPLHPPHWGVGAVWLSSAVWLGLSSEF